MKNKLSITYEKVFRGSDVCMIPYDKYMPVIANRICVLID
jgi:hypothetical protein